MTVMPLGQAFDLNPSVPLSRGTVAPFVDMASIRPFARDVRTEVLKPYSGGMKFLDGDVLMARITPSLENGKTSIYRAADGQPGPAFGSTEYIVVRGRSGISDSAFAYYLFTSDPVRKHAISQMNGSSGRQRVQQDALASLEIDLPSLEEQEDIAAILGAIDDKIASNDRAGRVLLKLATALYQKSLEESSEVETVGKLAEFHNRRRVPLSGREREKRLGSIPYYGATGVFGFVDEALFDEILVLVGEDGSVVREDGGPVLQYIWGPAWINNHAHPLTGASISTELLYLALDSADVRPLVTGAVQPKVSMGNLKSLLVAVPKGESRSWLEHEISPIFDMYRSRVNETKRLSELRNALREDLLTPFLRLQKEEVAA